MQNYQTWLMFGHGLTISKQENVVWHYLPAERVRRGQT